MKNITLKKIAAGMIFMSLIAGCVGYMSGCISMEQRNQEAATNKANNKAIIDEAVRIAEKEKIKTKQENVEMKENNNKKWIDGRKLDSAAKISEMIAELKNDLQEYKRNIDNELYFHRLK